VKCRTGRVVSPTGKKSRKKKKQRVGANAWVLNGGTINVGSEKARANAKPNGGGGRQTLRQRVMRRGGSVSRETLSKE